MVKEVLQKMAKYYVGVIKKFGIVIPAIIAAVAYAIVLTMDLLNVPSKLLNGGVVWFVIIAVVLVGAVVFGAIYTIKNLEAKEYAIQDVALTIIAAVGVLTILTIIFTSGVNAMSATKWIVVVAGTVLAFVLSFLRTKNID